MTKKEKIMVKNVKENSMELEVLMSFKEIALQLKRIADAQEALVEMQLQSQALMHELASVGDAKSWHREP
jgi:hypothetical protein